MKAGSPELSFHLVRLHAAAHRLLYLFWGVGGGVSARTRNPGGDDGAERESVNENKRTSE